MGFIYKITTPTGKLYVGQTKNLTKRIRKYKYDSINYTGNMLIVKSIAKYGWDKHKLEIIEEIEEHLLDERETFWINELKTYKYMYPNGNGINMKTGGAGGGSKGKTWKNDIDRVKKHSECMSGMNNFFYGKKHTEETLRIQSERARKRQKERGITIPEWGAEKGRSIVRKKVHCFDADGSFVFTYKSVTDAAEDTGVDISCVAKVCNGKLKSSGGYSFQYAQENISVSANPIPKNTTFVKRSVVLVDESMQIIQEYVSAKEAAEKNNLNKDTVKWATRLKKKLGSGHLFIYKDEYENENLN